MFICSLSSFQSDTLASSACHAQSTLSAQLAASSTSIIPSTTVQLTTGIQPNTVQSKTGIQVNTLPNTFVSSTSIEPVGDTTFQPSTPDVSDDVLNEPTTNQPLRFSKLTVLQVSTTNKPMSTTDKPISTTVDPMSTTIRPHVDTAETFESTTESDESAFDNTNAILIAVFGKLLKKTSIDALNL